MKSVLVTGASGFIGSRLCQALVEAGHEVRAMTRRPDDYSGAGTPVAGDVSDPDSLADRTSGRRRRLLPGALPGRRRLRGEGCRGGPGLQRGSGRERAGADHLPRRPRPRRRRDLSPHLRSRREVEGLLGADGVPVTVLRAAIVSATAASPGRSPGSWSPPAGDGGAQVGGHPDAADRAVGRGALSGRGAGAAAARGQIYEVGGPDVLSYAEMMKRVARRQYGRPLPILIVPLLTPRLSSHWLALVTDVDLATARNLVDSMNNEVVVSDHSIRSVVPGEPMGYDEAVELAFAERERERASSIEHAATGTGEPADLQPGPDQGGRALGRQGGRRRPAGVHRQGGAGPPAERRPVPAPPGRGRHHLGARVRAARPVVLHPAGRSAVLPADLRAGRGVDHRQPGVRTAPSRSHHAEGRVAAADPDPDPGRRRTGRGLRRRRIRHPLHPAAGRAWPRTSSVTPAGQSGSGHGDLGRQRHCRGAVLPRRLVRRHRGQAPRADLHGAVRADHRRQRQSRPGLRRRRSRSRHRPAAARVRRRARRRS